VSKWTREAYGQLAILIGTGVLLGFLLCLILHRFTP
jgi:hypothetical protein